MAEKPKWYDEHKDIQKERDGETEIVIVIDVDKELNRKK